MDNAANIISDKVLIKNAPLVQFMPTRKEYGKVKSVKIECFLDNADEMEIIVDKNIKMTPMPIRSNGVSSTEEGENVSPGTVLRRNATRKSISNAHQNFILPHEIRHE